MIHTQFLWYRQTLYLHHKPGNTHNKPDFLSRPPGLDKGEKDNKNVTLLPTHHFCSLYLNLQGAELILGAFPEAVRHQLTSIKCTTYD